MTTAGTILLYHAAFSDVPKLLSGHLHNVHPDEISRQWGWLKAEFDVLPLDSFLKRSDRSGAVALTFDDGYRSSLDAAAALSAEFCVDVAFFLNARMLAGGAFWRDQIRAILSAGEGREFIAHASAHGFPKRSLGWRTLYQDSKRPDIDSHRLMAALDTFFADLDPALAPDFIAMARELPDTPRFTYANHTANHPELASLAPEAIRRELEEGLAAVEALTLNEARRSRAFAIPFGTGGDRPALLDLARRTGHDAVLFAGRPQAEDFGDVAAEMDLVVADRLTAPATLAELQHLMTHGKA